MRLGHSIQFDNSHPSEDANESSIDYLIMKEVESLQEPEGSLPSDFFNEERDLSLASNNTDAPKRGILHNFAGALNEMARNAGSCDEYTIVKVAGAYDSSYCSKMGGAGNAEASIEQMVRDASKFFEVSDVCVKLEVSYMEGNCDSRNDKYLVSPDQEGATRNREFREYWDENNPDVTKDLAYLVTATPMKDRRLLGYSIREQVCKSFPYGHIAVLGGFNQPDPHVLLAHEIAHSLGATHYDVEEGYLMNKKPKSACHGLDSSSISTIREVVDAADCLAVESRVPKNNSTKFLGLMSLFLPVLIIGFLVKKMNGQRARKS